MENRVLKLLAKPELFLLVVRNFLSFLALLVGFSSSGAVTFKAMNSFSAATGTQPFGQLLRSTNGLFYGTTASGGDNGLGAIYSATTGGALNLPTPAPSTIPLGTATLTFQSCISATLTFRLLGQPSTTAIALKRIGPVPPGCNH